MRPDWVPGPASLLNPDGDKDPSCADKEALATPGRGGESGLIFNMFPSLPGGQCDSSASAGISILHTPHHLGNTKLALSSQGTYGPDPFSGRTESDVVLHNSMPT